MHWCHHYFLDSDRRDAGAEILPLNFPVNSFFYQWKFYILYLFYQEFCFRWSVKYSGSLEMVNYCNAEFVACCGGFPNWLQWHPLEVWCFDLVFIWHWYWRHSVSYYEYFFQEIFWVLYFTFFGPVDFGFILYDLFWNPENLWPTSLIFRDAVDVGSYTVCYFAAGSCGCWILN